MAKVIAKKRFGQNFLIDNYIINEIVKIINPKSDETLVEIGPGFGAITKPILEYIADEPSFKQLHVIELDWDIIRFLKNNFGNKLIIHESDALKFNFSFNNTPIRVIGNLPYNISTPILFHLANYNNIKDMHFMLQKEVVDRICAKPDSKDYGRLTVMIQYKFKCFKMLDVAKECFDPQPKVESAIIRLKPKPESEWEMIDQKKLGNLVTHAFNQRRKTIQNSLKGLVPCETLEELNIDTKKRAENLTISEYIKLAAAI
ncbi:MAG: 16S rRNA (adenine(1518)-N(6)/adenine(1519)-N(6))-dimethyltransferase RsmA [Neisseriaceae bacterium]